MALSDKRILEEMENGNVIISPFNQHQLNTSSYDVRLGEWFFREQPPQMSENIFDPWHEEEVALVWGRPEKAASATEALPPHKLDCGGIATDDRVIVIRPGETILAHTEEFIGGKNCITTTMQARSSLGRYFVEVCKCAGWGDVGFTNRWTMEVTNNSRHYSIPLPVGMRIAQIVFIWTGEILGPDYTTSGKYQETDDLSQLEVSWRPEMMLPRLHRDREARQQRLPL